MLRGLMVDFCSPETVLNTSCEARGKFLIIMSDMEESTGNKALNWIYVLEDIALEESQRAI